MRPVELEIHELPVSELVPYANNAKKHPQKQVNEIAESISKFGNCDPIGVWHNEQGEAEIVEGHGRVLALNQLGIETAPVIFLDHLTDEERRIYTHVHNQTTLSSDFDYDALIADMDNLNADWEAFGFEEYAYKDSSLFEHPDDYTGEHRMLQDDFVIPPFSVLDTRQGYWRNRAQAWEKITGNLSESRSNSDGKGMFTRGGTTNKLMMSVSGATSNFDPVLAEVMYRWFCPKGGKILDPFGGEQTKGVVAGVLGYRYKAVELRQEQVDIDVEATKAYSGIEYVCGDSANLDTLIDEDDFDMCFTSPPYYDLEIYSDDEGDMSAFGTYDEFMALYEAIFSKCYAKMADGSFLVIKVGEIRDDSGKYRGFVPDTVAAMQRIGFAFYNEMILVNAIATAAVRARRSMATRKVVKTHQNVLVFYKGDLKKIKEKFPKLEFEGLEELDG